MNICIPGASQLELCTINPHLHLYLFIFKNILHVQGPNQWKAKTVVTDYADKDKYNDTANFWHNMKFQEKALSNLV